ncbi:MAG: T9SS type A sorting domain-containing protein [bacterium]|nr:T9SS type A sorting domain-containing protein [bacterium]
MEGENQILVYLVDRQYQSLDPVVSDIVTIHYTPLNPSITITWPTQPPDTLEWYDDNPPYFQFIVEDFVVADSGGDGRIHLQVRDFWRNEEPFESSFHVVFDSIEVPLWYFTTNEIVLSLVDYDGNQLVPHIADTVFVRAWQVAADPIPGGIPTEFAIANTYPNPFNSTLSIQYDVPTPAHVSLSVYDLTGRQVATLVNSVQPSGSHSTSWQADNFPSGLYFLNLRSGGHSESRKIVLLK